jgi:hypothetical protein
MAREGGSGRDGRRWLPWSRPSTKIALIDRSARLLDWASAPTGQLRNTDRPWPVGDRFDSVVVEYVLCRSNRPFGAGRQSAQASGFEP